MTIPPRSDEREPAPSLDAILANLGREICRPLDLLRAGIEEILDDPTLGLVEPELAQARTIRTLCDDLTRLTRQSLGPIEGDRGETARVAPNPAPGESRDG